MFVQITRSKTGDTYPYFVCRGRHNKKTDCQLCATLIADIEEKVTRLYDDFRRESTSEVRAQFEVDLHIELLHRSARSKQALHELGLEQQRLRHEQERLLQAHYADAIPLDLLKKEQDRIGALLRRSETQHRALTQDLGEAESFVLCSSFSKTAPWSTKALLIRSKNSSTRSSSNASKSSTRIFTRS